METLLVIKIGGHVVDREESLEDFLGTFAALQRPRILVHGGGKIATRVGERLGIVSHYVNGRRITDAATMDLVTMVYGGLVNKKIVARLQACGCAAIGLTGADANILPARRRPPGEVDYGFAGDVQAGDVHAGRLRLLMDHALVPVVAPLTHDGQGQLLNTNADTIASALAVALSPWYRVRLIYCFEKKGVLRDVADEEDVVSRIDRAEYDRLLQAGALADGILPKLDNAFDAIAQGVAEVLIGHARDLEANAGDQHRGTLVSS